MQMGGSFDPSTLDNISGTQEERVVAVFVVLAKMILYTIYISVKGRRHYSQLSAPYVAR